MKEDGTSSSRMVRKDITEDKTLVLGLEGWFCRWMGEGMELRRRKQYCKLTKA